MLKKVKQWQENKRAKIIDYIGAFGKLPVQSEFIKHAFSDPFTRELDLWYQRAYSKLNSNMGEFGKALFADMPTYQFMYYSPKTLPVIGSAFSSRDASGRRYPFVTLRRLKHPMAVEFLYAVPLLFGDYLQATENFYKACNVDQSLSEASHQIRQLALQSYPLMKLPALESALKKLNHIEPRGFHHLLQLDNPSLSFDSFEKQLNTLPDQLKQAANNKQITKYQFILPQSQALRLFATYYFQLINQAFSLKEKTWQLYWQYGGKQHLPQMLLTEKPLTPDEWLVFVSQQQVLENCQTFKIE